MKVVEIKQDEFKEKIKGKKVVVDCYATWCGPCRMLSPIIDELASENDEVEFYKLDVDDAEEVSRSNIPICEGSTYLYTGCILVPSSPKPDIPL